jgi:hypothetical protein
MKVGAEKWKFLQDEPCAQVISYTWHIVPSFLPKYRETDRHWSAEYGFQVAEANILRKAECIVITWCSTIVRHVDYSHTRQAGPPAMRFYVYRGGKLALESRIPLPMPEFFEVNIFCVTLRRKHRVVEAVKAGDRLCVFTDWCNYVDIRVLDANVCVVYNGGGHLLLEVNSELLSKDASQELEEQFGELVLNQNSRGK